MSTKSQISGSERGQSEMVPFTNYARYILICRFAVLTGYTPKAVARKIEDGVWIEGIEYVHGPDGRILVDMVAYEVWVTGGVLPIGPPSPRPKPNTTFAR